MANTSIFRADLRIDALFDPRRQPPRAGRYAPFVDYPQRDYCVGGVAAARALNPEVGSREALRQLGQLEFPTVAGSTLGRVMLAGVVDILVV
ncbi:MAG: DUF2378 family protein [Polyangiaceae bacterium]|nr:DUF2378 family protein [Polyangiaceae bacterium]